MTLAEIKIIGITDKIILKEFCKIIENDTLGINFMSLEYYVNDIKIESHICDWIMHNIKLDSHELTSSGYTMRKYKVIDIINAISKD